MVELSKISAPKPMARGPHGSNSAPHAPTQPTGSPVACGSVPTCAEQRRRSNGSRVGRSPQARWSSGVSVSTFGSAGTTRQGRHAGSAQAEFGDFPSRCGSPSALSHSASSPPTRGSAPTRSDTPRGARGAARRSVPNDRIPARRVYGEVQPHAQRGLPRRSVASQVMDRVDESPERPASIRPLSAPPNSAPQSTLAWSPNAEVPHRSAYRERRLSPRQQESPVRVVSPPALRSGSPRPSGGVIRNTPLFNQKGSLTTFSGDQLAGGSVGVPGLPQPMPTLMTSRVSGAHGVTMMPAVTGKRAEPVSAGVVANANCGVSLHSTSPLRGRCGGAILQH